MLLHLPNLHAAPPDDGSDLLPRHEKYFFFREDAAVATSTVTSGGAGGAGGAAITETATAAVEAATTAFTATAVAATAPHPGSFHDLEDHCTCCFAIRSGLCEGHTTAASIVGLAPDANLALVVGVATARSRARVDVVSTVYAGGSLVLDAGRLFVYIRAGKEHHTSAKYKFACSSAKYARTV